MAKLPKLTGKELAKLVEKFGFIYSHTTGSHMVYKHPDGRKTTIPPSCQRGNWFRACQKPPITDGWHVNITLKHRVVF